MSRVQLTAQFLALTIYVRGNKLPLHRLTTKLIISTGTPCSYSYLWCLENWLHTSDLPFSCPFIFMMIKLHAAVTWNLMGKCSDLEFLMSNELYFWLGQELKKSQSLSVRPMKVCLELSIVTFEQSGSVCCLSQVFKLSFNLLRCTVGA